MNKTESEYGLVMVEHRVYHIHRPKMISDREFINGPKLSVDDKEEK